MENLQLNRSIAFADALCCRALAALAALGPATLAGAPVGAQPRTNMPQAKPKSAETMFAYVGAFTTPERKGSGHQGRQRSALSLSAAKAGAIVAS